MTTQNTDRAIRHFDFANELVIELAHPDVHQAYQRWQAVADAQNALPLFEPDQPDPTPLYEAFLAVARAHDAVSPLT